MKIVINNIIPFKGYDSMIIYPFIFAKGRISSVTYNHECIHGEQQKETLIIFFLLLYILEYIIKFIITFNVNRTYKSISFEQEAYKFDKDKNYINNRQKYCWIKYIFKLK